MGKSDPIFEGDIVKGNLIMPPQERQKMSLYIETFTSGTHVELTLREYKSQRSTQQNRYYWGVVIKTLCSHFEGYHPEEMHEEMKLLFNPKFSKFFPDVERGGSTATLNTKEFKEYIDKIVIWAATDHGIEIPEANYDK